LRKREQEGRKSRPQNNGGVPQAEQENSTSTTNVSLAGLEGRLQLTEEYLRSLEAKAKIKLNELKLEKLLDAAKADFSSYINTLFGSHRHQHLSWPQTFTGKFLMRENTRLPLPIR